MIRNLIARIGSAKRQFNEDSLFRNAIYLILSTTVMAVLGFIFWLLVAHWYRPGDIGVASALISVATLLSSLSLLGLNAGLIRFLSKSKNQSGDFNAASILVAVVSLVSASIYVIAAPKLGLKLSLLSSAWEQVSFILLMAIVSLNSLTDSVFIANRKGEYHTVGYATFSIVKLVIPFFLVSFGSMGVFAAYAFAMLASLLISYYLMWSRLSFRFFARPNWSFLPFIRGYSMSNYFGVVLSNLPSQLLPLLIIRRLGAAQVAYFAMASTMANLLYIVPTAASQSLLAETAHDPTRMKEHLFRAIRILTYLLVPLVLIAVITAPYLLSLFGSTYMRYSTSIFRLLAISTFLVAIGTVGNTVLNIERNTKAIVLAQAGALLVTAVSSVLLIHKGLLGIGVALMMGYATASLIQAVIYTRTHQLCGAVSRVINRVTGRVPQTELSRTI